MTDPTDRPGGRWSRIGGPLAILVAAASFGSIAVSTLIPSQAERELAAFVATPERPDPAVSIPGIEIGPGGTAGPATDGPVGGPYARCDGITYPAPLPEADVVQSLARGAVWITYDPARVAPGTVAALGARVSDGTHLMMSPYPGLATPVSLQAWGHRLFLETPDDPRLEQFLLALSANPFTPPQPGSPCGPTR